MSEIQLIDILNTPETKHMMNSYGISHVRVFGSYGQNTQTEESDIDLMYEYDDSTPWKDRGIFGAQEQLSEITKKQVHLVNREFLDKYIKESVLSNSKKIW